MHIMKIKSSQLMKMEFQQKILRNFSNVGKDSHINQSLLHISHTCS
jgi:hypothetical protein